MVSFAELKKKAEETAKNTAGSSGLSSHSSKGPPPPKPTKYVPVRPGEVALGKLPSLEDRRLQSVVLNAPGAAPLPPPPPPPIRRGAIPTTSQSSTTATVSTTPIQSPSQARGSRGPAPAPPLRTLSTSSSFAAIEGQSEPPYARESPIDPPFPPSRSNQPSSSGYSSVVLTLPHKSSDNLSRSTQIPAPSNQSSFRGAVAPYKRFSQYDAEDKESFFGMLDTFFQAKFKDLDTVDSGRSPINDETDYLVQSSKELPPSLPLSTRPRDLPSSAKMRSSLKNPSYPPRVSHSSSALSLLHYLLYADYHSWYAEGVPGTPPPLANRTDLRRSDAWTQTGPNKSLLGVALFGDASIAWWKLSWSVHNEHLLTSREGRYRPVPESWDGARLYTASEMYGALVLEFAQAAVNQRKPVARGECWDMAAEALSSIEMRSGDLPKPFPSISGTHGHCIFYGRAGGSNEGTWKGGDPYVRAGDIVQWKSVTIREVGMSELSWSTLGDPDHTAVIVVAETPVVEPKDDEIFPIAHLGSLTVIEQSQGKVPSQKTYDMKAMSAGELWIYRPVPLIEYVGADVEPLWPPPCDCYEVGQMGMSLI